jgi:hypothetical protein
MTRRIGVVWWVVDKVPQEVGWVNRDEESEEVMVTLLQTVAFA